MTTTDEVAAGDESQRIRDAISDIREPELQTAIGKLNLVRGIELSK